MNSTYYFKRSTLARFVTVKVTDSFKNFWLSIFSSIRGGHFFLILHGTTAVDVWTLQKT